LILLGVLHEVFPQHVQDLKYKILI